MRIPDDIVARLNELSIESVAEKLGDQGTVLGSGDGSLIRFSDSRKLVTIPFNSLSSSLRDAVYDTRIRIRGRFYDPLFWAKSCVWRKAENVLPGKATTMRLLQILDRVLEPVGQGVGCYYRIRNY